MKIRKITILLISLIILVGSVIFFMYEKDKKVYKDAKNNKITLAIMVEKGTGKYVEYKSKEWPKYGYRFSKAECVDRDRNNIGNLVTYDALTNTAYMNSTRTAFCTLYFDKDNSAPVIGDGSFYVGSTVDQEYTNKVNEEVHIKIEDEDVIEYCLSLDSDSRSCEGKWSPIPELTEGWFTVPSFNLGNTDGTKIVYLYLKDGARNISESQDSIVLDTTPPECRIWGESTSWTSGNRTIRWGCDDASSGCKVIETGSKEYKVTTKTAPIAEYEIEDNVGYKTTCNVTANVYVDKDAPSCNISGNPTSWTNSNKTLTGNGTDTGEGSVYYKWNTGNYGATSGSNNTTTASSNGRYTLYVKDGAGNENNCYVDVSKIDKNAPSCNISGNTTTWTASKTLTGSGTDTGEGSVYYKWDTGSYGSTSGANNTKTVSSNGTYTLYVKDGAGNETSCNVSVSKVDNSAPSCSISGNPTSWTKNNQTLTGSGTDTGEGTVYYSWDNKNNYSTTTKTKTVSSNGTYTLYVKDRLGNETSCNVTVSKIDKDAPSCSISGNPTSWTKNNQTLTGSGTDTGEGTVYYSWDNKNNYSTTTKTKTVSSNGTYTLYIKDGLGNETNCNVAVSKIDKEGPTVATSTIRYDSSTGTIRTNANTWTNKTLWWGNFSATDSGIGVDHYEYSTNCTENKSGNLSSSYTYDTDRDWTFCIRAVDGLGNPGDWSSAYYFRIDKTKPSVSFDISGQTATYTCSNGGSGSPLSGTTSGNHALSGTSNYTYSVTCTDEAGNSKTDSHTYTYGVISGSNTCRYGCISECNNYQYSGKCVKNNITFSGKCLCTTYGDCELSGIAAGNAKCPTSGYSLSTNATGTTCLKYSNCATGSDTRVWGFKY